MTETAGEALGDVSATSLSKEQAAEMADQLTNGSLDIANVPTAYHQSLYSALSLAKFEARIGGRMELYDKINDIMWSMKLTPVMPEREVYLPMCSLTSPTRCREATTGRLTQTMFTHNVSIVKAVTSRGEPGGEAAIRKLESQLAASQKFWADEEARFYNMREKSIAKMKKQHAAFKFSRNPIDADEERNELACEMNNLKREWVAKESKFFADKNAEIRRIREEIRRVKGETARSQISTTHVYEEEEHTDEPEEELNEQQPHEESAHEDAEIQAKSHEEEDEVHEEPEELRTDDEREPIGEECFSIPGTEDDDEGQYFPELQ